MWDALPCPPPTEAQCPARVNLFKWGGHAWGTASYQDWWIDNDNFYEPDNTYPSRNKYCVFMVGYGNQPPDHPGTWDDDLCDSKRPITVGPPFSPPPTSSPPPSKPPPKRSPPPPKRSPPPPKPPPSPPPPPPKWSKSPASRSPPLPMPIPSPPPSPTPPPTPQTAVNFQLADIAATTPGTSTFTAGTGVWQIAICGNNIYSLADSFRYVYGSAKNDKAGEPSLFRPTYDKL
eukprot:jgi/Chlat1/4157/Chrsp27S04231